MPALLAGLLGDSALSILKDLIGPMIQFALAYVAVGIMLYVSGQLFDYSIQITLLDFGTYFGSGSEIMQFVYTVWMMFRDVANILIIGSFVFISLSIILGVERYGTRKAIVNLIAAALLINFSMFFTQVVIDISNFLAVMVYNTMIPPDSSQTLSTIFSSTMGISGFFQASAALLGQIASLSFLQAPLYAITSVIFWLITATLFFRIAFAFIGRLVVLIVLMATSALAVGASLIPPFSKYWDMWYWALVKNATLAPLLMALLWAVAIIGGGVQKALPHTLSSTSFIGVTGKLVTESGRYELFGSIISYMLIAGLLWAAIRTATTLSDEAAASAGQLGKWVGTGLGAMQGLFTKTGGGLAFGRYGLAGALQGTVGTGFARMQSSLEAAAQNAAPGSIRQRMYDSLAGSKFIKSGADAKYDARNTKIAAAFSKQAGVSLGAGVKESLSAYNKRLEERATKLAKDQQAAVIKEQETQTEIYNEMQEDRKRADAERESVRKSNEAADQRQAAEEKRLSDQMADIERASRGKENEYQAQENELNIVRKEREDALAAAGITDEAEAKQMIQDGDQKIRTISGEITRAEAELSNLRAREGTGNIDDAGLARIAELNKTLSSQRSHLEQLKSLKRYQDTSMRIASLEDIHSRLGLELNGLNTEKERLGRQYTERMAELGEEKRLRDDVLAMHNDAVAGYSKQIGVMDKEFEETATKLNVVKMANGLSTAETAELEQFRAMSPEELVRNNEYRTRFGELRKREREYKKAREDAANSLRKTAKQRSDEERKKKLEDAQIKFAETTEKGGAKSEEAPKVDTAEKNNLNNAAK